MQAGTDRLEFAPPPPGGVARSLSLAVLAHLVLLAALTWGVRWKRDAENLSVEAELWSAIPQQAAPRPVEAPPPPPPPPPAPAPRVQAPPPPPAVRDADIALEREKKKRELEKERERQEKLELQKKAEAEKKKELEARKKQQEKERLAKEKEKEKDRQEAERKADAERARKEAEAKKQEAQRLEAQRQENIRRMQGLAGATGDANATGTAQRSSGPSASYAGRIVARIKPNIGFMDEVSGNPVAEVEVRAAPDGTITGRKLLKSSGLKSWDEAVLKAIDRTETLPRDTDGRVPPVFILGFRPKD